MPLNTNRLCLPLALCLAAMLQPVTSAQEDHSGYCSSSLIIIGDTTQSPLDEGSINALFTSRFIAQVAEKLAEKHQWDANELTPSMIRFQYQGAKEGPGRVATLLIHFENISEEISEKVRTDAPQVARDMLVENAYEFFEVAHQYQANENMDRLKNLKAARNDIRERLEETQRIRREIDGGAIESSEPLKQVYLDLRTQQLQDRMKLLANRAKREAVEKQIEKFGLESEQKTKQLTEKRETARLQDSIARSEERKRALIEQQTGLKMALADKENQLAALKDSRGDKSPKIELVQAELSQLKQAHELIEDKLRKESSSKQRADIDRLNTEAMFLRFAEQQSQSSKQLAQLNQMLTQLAIETDESAAYRNVLEDELARMEDKIRRRADVETEINRIDQQARMLSRQLERIEQTLLELEIQADMPMKPNFKIMPWGP